MNNTIKQMPRNYSLDILKLIASLFVVFIHVNFYGEVGALIKAFGSFAVPVFFMSSGFFSFDIINDCNYKKILSRIISLLKIFLFSLLIYSVVYIAINGFSAFLSFFYLRDTYIKLFIFNSFENTFYTPLWFLPALIYCYIIVLILTKLKLNKIIPYLSLLLLCYLAMNIVIARYNVSDILLRNFLLPGLPYYAVGYTLKKYQHHSVFQYKHCQAYILCLLVLSLILFVILHFTLGFSVFAVVIISILLFIMSLLQNLAIHNTFLGFFIQKSYLYIYISHWLVWNIMLNRKLTVNEWVNPLIVLGISIGISFVISGVKMKMKQRLNQKLRFSYCSAQKGNR